MPTNNDLRRQLTQASAFLSENGAPQLAQAVDTVLAPGGWALIKPAISSGKNMAIAVPEALRDELHAAAKAAGDSLTDIVNEGFDLTVNGSYTPHIPARERGTVPKVLKNLNVTPDDTLRQQVKDMGLEPTKAALDYLTFKYQVGRYAAGSSTPVGQGKDRNTNVPREVRDRIREAAAAAGRSATEDVNEGLAAYLAGNFASFPLSWPADVQDDMVVLKLRPNDDLYQQVMVAGRERAAEAGFTARPLQVGVSFLLSKYGIEIK
ncbi:hypothetical protein [Streptomyces sp. t39]|uniref:hypothetical protein n=1 Tax=Streptomyces sp. t39 TaxID=1828156 RepID=UPI0011CD7045|nr:hypothetical protein [Streptomyces sp. t39]TXS51639.1 hypothetical protein EAO77_27795 [Streptomyces sp. t39]